MTDIINIDEDEDNADWIKHVGWDLPVDLEPFLDLAFQQADPERWITKMMGRQTMPATLRVQLPAKLDPIQQQHKSMSTMETKIKHVNSRAGEARYNLPLGAIIRERGDKIPFKPNKVTIHHSNTDGSAAVVASQGVKHSVVMHPTMASAQKHAAELMAPDKSKPKDKGLVHLFHNIEGRLHIISGKDVRSQMPTGAFEHVGSVRVAPSGSVVATPLPKSAAKRKIMVKNTSHSTVKAALQHLSGKEPSATNDDGIFAVTMKLRDAIKGVHSKNMRDAKPGEKVSPGDIRIPPGNTQIEVARSADHRLQVRSRDMMGRIQSTMSKKHTEDGDAAKFARIKILHDLLPKLDKKMTAAELDKNDTAVAVYMMRHSGIRVDSAGNTKKTVSSTKTGVPTYGAATLLKKHVKIKDGVAHLDFNGKDSVRNTARFSDPAIVKALQKRMNGKKINDPLFNTNSDMTGDYIRQHTGYESEHANHDLRTHVGTSLAHQIVADMEDWEYPETEDEHKDWIKDISTEVSEQLNNTPKIALDKYIDPAALIPLRKKMGG